jgi:hypothetical protein
MSLSLSELQQRLSTFTELVVSNVNYESALRLMENSNLNGSVSYQAVPENNCEITLMWEVLSHEKIEGKSAVQIFTHICDDQRGKGILGSVWTPLCSGAWIYQDGSIDFHTMGNLAANIENE